MPAKTVTSNVLCLAATIAIGFAITPSRAGDEKPHDPWENVNVKGSNNWYTLAQLKKVSDVHLLKREPAVNLRRFEVTANVDTDDRGRLVMFQYFENFGLPVFHVTLNRAGEVMAFTNRIASERIDVTTPPLPKGSK